MSAPTSETSESENESAADNQDEPTPSEASTNLQHKSSSSTSSDDSDDDIDTSQNTKHQNHHADQLSEPNPTPSEAPSDSDANHDDAPMLASDALPLGRYDGVRFKLSGVSPGGPAAPLYPLRGAAAAAAARAATAEAKAAEQLEKRRAELGEAASYVAGGLKVTRVVPIKQFWAAVDEHLRPLPPTDPLQAPLPPPQQPLLVDRVLAALVHVPAAAGSGAESAPFSAAAPVSEAAGPSSASALSSVVTMSGAELARVNRRLRHVLESAELLHRRSTSSCTHSDPVADELRRSASRLHELSRASSIKLTKLRMRAHASQSSDQRVKLKSVAAQAVRKRFGKLKSEAAPPPVKKAVKPASAQQRAAAVRGATPPV